MAKTITLGVAMLAITLAGCSTMKGRPEEPAAPARGTKLAEISGQSFESGRARLTAAGRKQVDEAMRVLQQHPDVRVAIDGHTDASGKEASNQVLSERRARAVANRLIEQGVPAARLTVRGFGESRPVADNATADGRSRNRRVEIVVE